MSSERFNTFNGGNVCVANSTSNFHELAATRKTNGLCSTNTCGDPDDAEKLFCNMGSAVCPLNQLQIMTQAEQVTFTADAANSALIP
jgi:hypothetical protein